jgi:hypothetical protein
MESTATQQLQTEDATTRIESLEVARLLTSLDKELKDMCTKMLESLERRTDGTEWAACRTGPLGGPHTSTMASLSRRSLVFKTNAVVQPTAR